MNNATLFTADRKTHLKIVVIALVASIMVSVIGIVVHAAPIKTAGYIETVGSDPAVKSGKPIQSAALMAIR